MPDDKEGAQEQQNPHKVLVNTAGRSSYTALTAGGIANLRLTITADQTRTNKACEPTRINTDERRSWHAQKTEKTKQTIHFAKLRNTCCPTGDAQWYIIILYINAVEFNHFYTINAELAE